MIDRSQRVYFATCIGPLGPMGAIKIGCSHRWNERVAGLTANLPFSLKMEASVPGGIVLEATCHLRLEKHRIGGEYFIDNEETRRMVDRAASEGQPFLYIRDDGSEYLPDGAVQAFLRFHEISLQEVSLRLGVPAKKFEAAMQKPRFHNRRVIAAAALIAAGRDQWVSWPDNAIRGLLGEVAPAIERRRSEASSEAA